MGNLLSNRNSEHLENTSSTSYSSIVWRLLLQILFLQLVIFCAKHLLTFKRDSNSSKGSHSKSQDLENFLNSGDFYDFFLILSNRSESSWGKISPYAELSWTLLDLRYTHKYFSKPYSQNITIELSKWNLLNSGELFVNAFVIPHKSYKTRREQFLLSSELKKGLDGYIFTASSPLIKYFKPLMKDEFVSLSSQPFIQSAKFNSDNLDFHKHIKNSIYCLFIYHTGKKNQNSIKLSDYRDFRYSLQTYKYYTPLDFNEFWLLDRNFIDLDETKQSYLTLEFYFSLSSLNYRNALDNFERQIEQQSALGLPVAKEFNSFKRIILDTNLYFLIFSIIFISLHSVFSFFAFKNDMQFWYKNDSMRGLSALSLVYNLFCEVIIGLYLLDTKETSWLIIFELFMGIFLSLWKVSKAIKLRIVPYPPFIALNATKSYTESSTNTYDKIAIKYMTLSLMPCTIGYAIYSFYNFTYRSWYSYLISVLAGVVYTFGFIMMTPQLYINYKLKSVEHLPWRALMYKSLNTFVDDVAAFLIDMPWMHRLSCFRDDVIFIIYVYQRWIYNTDKKRSNNWTQPTPNCEEKLDNSNTPERLEDDTQSSCTKHASNNNLSHLTSAFKRKN